MLMYYPNDTITTPEDGVTSIVVASVYLDDTDPDGERILLLVLNPGPNYYSVVETQNGIHHVLETFPNIVPAVAYYEESGGDY